VLEHPAPSSVEVGTNAPPPIGALEEQARASSPDHLEAPSDQLGTLPDVPVLTVDNVNFY